MHDQGRVQRDRAAQLGLARPQVVDIGARSRKPLVMQYCPQVQQERDGQYRAYG